MSSTDSVARAGRPVIGFFERYLTVWVALCIIAGIALGQWLPSLFQAIGRMEIAQVNLPVGVLIWVMIIPMLIKIDFGAMAQIKGHWRGIGVTLFVNWLVKPFSMALLGWIFVRHVFAPGCLQRNSTATLPASFCWPPPLARRWCSSGRSFARAIPISPCRKWR